MKTAENISDPILLEQFIVIADFKKTERNQVIFSNQNVVFCFHFIFLDLHQRIRTVDYVPFIS